jgi:hypothetical protein
LVPAQGARKQSGRRKLKVDTPGSLSDNWQQDRRDSKTISERITIEADMCGRRPSFRGLRIRVKDIIVALA